MDPTTNQLIRAGALSQLCLYHYRQGDKDHDWSITRLYALREFREVPIDIIDKLLDKCKQACIAARWHRERPHDLGLNKKYIPRLYKE